ncbi:uncharacterized protein LOC126470754 [Schistocerca serialis cubense]|uniref:uncharacterized protein LOC126470754 n=1 Tax=Schistocerca serialis cubense TaxID=2023355 RepID=UPI00214EA701|nr:uncharacterized protein LOC126470754 [Schistocerca serialis cubense]
MIMGNECKDNWNKLRKAYIQAKHRRATKSGQAAESLSKWKFEDEMAFLNPTLVTRKTRGNAEDSPNNEDYDGTREETGLCPIDETDSQVALSKSSQSNPPRNDLLKSAVPTMAQAIDNPTVNVSDSPTTFTQPSAKPVQNKLSEHTMQTKYLFDAAIRQANVTAASRLTWPHAA